MSTEDLITDVQDNTTTAVDGDTGAKSSSTDLLTGEVDDGQDNQGTAKTDNSKEGGDNTPDPSKEGNQDDDKGPQNDGQGGAPESYQDFTMPEGIELSHELKGQFVEKAKGLNLNQEQAQEMVNLATKAIQDSNVKTQKDWVDVQNVWRDQIKNDPEFGGSKFDDTRVGANRALKRYGSPELVTWLKETGFCNNGELVKLLARVDQRVREDRTVDGEGSHKPKSTIEVFYNGQ